MSQLNKNIHEVIEKYFSGMDTNEAANLYQIILQEIEIPLFKTAIKHTGGNISKAATILGVNRGTLRKKLKEYKIVD
jgi:Fis family transcriptional regulator